MSILELNKKAWDKIGKRVASSYIKHKKYSISFKNFCHHLPKGASVLDLGCGPGLPFTKEFVKRGFKVTGVDISISMINLARKNVPRAKYFCMSMTDIDFKEEFDGVFAGYSMLCLDMKHFRIAAKKAVRSLIKGGHFLLTLNEPGVKNYDHREKCDCHTWTEDVPQALYTN